MKYCVLLVTAVLGATLACSDRRNREAEMLYWRAERYIENNQYEQAISVLQAVRINYEGTPHAKIAESEISEVERLQVTLMDNIINMIHNRFSRIAMSLENYRTRFLAFPLTPKDMEKLPSLVVPDWDDYWNNAIYYAATYSSPDLPRHSPDGYALATFGKDGLPGGTGPNQDHFYQSGQVVESLTP